MRFRQIFRNGCVLTLLLLVANQAPGQIDSREEVPAPAKPVQPLTAKDLAKREAMSLYGLGMARQHNDRLVDALRLLEQARQLDPESGSIARALAPLYVALNRSDDALVAARKAVECDPGDYETWVLLGRQLKRLRHGGRGRSIRAGPGQSPARRPTRFARSLRTRWAACAKT